MTTNHASFTAAPTDAAEYPDGSEPTGKSIAEFLTDALRAGGLSIMAPVNYEDFAWEFDARLDGRRFILLLGYVGDSDREWLLHARPAEARLVQLFRKPDEGLMLRLLHKINAALKSNSNYANVRWYTPEDWDRQPDTAWHAAPARL